MSTDRIRRRKWGWILAVVPLILFLWHQACPESHEPQAVDGLKATLPAANPAGASRGLGPSAGPTTGTRAQAESPSSSPAALNPKISPTFKKHGEFDLSKYEQRPEYIVAGRVTSEADDSLPGATVTIYRGRSVITGALEDPSANTGCDSTGHYEIRLGSPVMAWIGVHKEGYAHVDGRLDLRSPGVVTKNYTLKEAKEGVEGQVFETGGKPLPDAWISASFTSVFINPNGSGIGPRSTRSDQSGRYSISELPSEEMNIVAFTNRHLRQTKTIRLNSGHYERVDFELNPAASISFMVKNKRGKGIPLATASGPAGSCRADERGVVTLTLPFGFGPFESDINATGYKPKTVSVTPKMPPPEVVLDDAETCMGQVLSESGVPLADAMVDIFPSEGDVNTDSSGMFSVPISSPPVREIRVSKPGYMAERITYQNQRSPTFVEVRLKRVEAGIYGRVIDEDGKPVTRFSIVLWNLSPQSGTPPFGKFFDHEQGLFSITEVPAGLYRMTVNPVTDSTTNRLQQWESKQIEIRSGLFWGEILVLLSRPVNPPK